MLRPAVAFDKVRRAFHESGQYRWRPSNYIVDSSLRTNDTKTHYSSSSHFRAFIDIAALVAFLLISSFFFLTGHEQLRTIPPLPGTSGSSEYEMFNILGDFDGAGIRNMCEHKRFQEGLYFHCNEHDGGIGNVRNSILLCTRYAIEAGAQLVAPHIHLRSTEDLALLDGSLVDMTYLFDYDLFRHRIEHSCPGFRIWDSIEAIPEDIPLTWTPELWNPIEAHYAGGLRNVAVGLTRADAQEWIFNHMGVRVSAQTPVIVGLRRTLFGWHYSEDPYEVWVNWGKLLQFQPIVYKLAARILTLMAESEHSSALLAPVVMQDGFRFVGQHLRTEGDASVEMKVYGFDPQMEAAISTCKVENITSLYIATGDAGEAAKALERGLEHEITVHTKYSIVADHPELQAELLGMTFDQQALVDFLILLKSTQFVGVDSSSFSGNLVVTRHTSLADETHWQGFKDNLSFMIGDRYEWLREAQWP